MFAAELRAGRGRDSCSERSGDDGELGRQRMLRPSDDDGELGWQRTGWWVTKGTRNSEALDEVQIVPAGGHTADAVAPDEEERVEWRRRGARRRRR